MMLPFYDADRTEAISELFAIDGYDASYELAYYNSWSDYECSGWLAIFERRGEYFRCDGGYSPETGDVEERLLYEPISIETALEEIDAVEETCSEMAHKHSGKSTRTFKR